MSREEELKKQGWERKTVQLEPRLTELIDLYENIGLEVLLEPFRPEDIEYCTECFRRACDKYKVIYTRPLKEKY